MNRVLQRVCFLPRFVLVYFSDMALPSTGMACIRRRFGEIAGSGDGAFLRLMLEEPEGLLRENSLVLAAWSLVRQGVAFSWSRRSRSQRDGTLGIGGAELGGPLFVLCGLVMSRRVYHALGLFLLSLLRLLL